MAQIDKGHEASGPAPQVLTVSAPDVGEILADRYQIEAFVGDDSLGRQIYRGMDVILRRAVTVVMCYPGGEAARDMLAAAVAVSRVVHPHLAGVYDAIDEGDRAYVVREWIDGVSLREVVAEGPIDAGRAVAIAWAVADAVAALHATEVVHGNIHPGSVLIAHDGRVTLADARGDGATTQDADVRAVGGILYCSLTAFWPQAEAGSAPMADGVRNSDGYLVAPKLARPGVPDYIDDLAMGLLSLHAEAPSAVSLSNELAKVSQSVDEDTGSDGALGFAAFDNAAVAPEPNRPPRRKLAFGIGALVGLAVVGSLAATQLVGGPTPSSDPTPSSGGSSANAPKPAGAPRTIDLDGQQVRIVDSDGGDRTELDDADRMVDGSSSTTWKTDRYFNRGDFGGKKDGMGVLIDLGGVSDVVNVKVDMARAGATLDLRGGDADPGATAEGDKTIASTFPRIDGPKADVGTSVLFAGNDRRVRFLLVWITNLPQVANDRYQVEISEITVSVH